jgi:hypothetical protein
MGAFWILQRLAEIAADPRRSLAPSLPLGYRGYAPGESVLVGTPQEGGLPLPYGDGQTPTVRAFTGIGVFAFDAAIQRIVERPRPEQAVPLADYGVAFERLTLGQRVMLQNFVYHHLLHGNRLRV